MHVLLAKRNTSFGKNTEFALIAIYCDVPGPPCLSKYGSNVRSVSLSCRCPEPRVVCWRPHLAGTRQYLGFEQFYEFQNMTYPWTFQDIGRTLWNIWMGVFATCFKFLWSNMTLPGALDLDTGSQGKSKNSRCLSFETECISKTAW